MSKICKKVRFDPRRHVSAPLTTLDYDYPPNYVVRDHFHDTDQLVYASTGVMTVRTRSGIWVVPPRRAVWIPAETVHSVTMSGSVSMRTLYFSPKFVRSLPRNCCVVNISPLLRELILYACQSHAWETKNPVQRSLINILTNQLRTSVSTPLQLPRPSDRRALRVADVLLQNPSDSRTLSQICRSCGAGKRTVERLFLQETQLTLGRWRQQARLLHGVRLIAEGEKVITAALEAGYTSPSAFVSAFKKLLGATPGGYFK